MGEVSSLAMTERARSLAKPHKLSDRITLTKSLPIAVRWALSHSACPLRRSRASSPKGRANYIIERDIMKLTEWNARLHGLVIFRALLDDDVIAKFVDLTDRMAAAPGR